MTSPNSDRITKLGERLSSLHEGIRYGKSQKIDSIESKIRSLDSSYSHSFDHNNSSLHQLQDQIQKLEKALADQNINREEHAEAKLRETQKLKVALSQILERELNARKQSEARLYGQIDELTSGIRGDISLEANQCQDSLEGFSLFLSNDIPGIRDTIKKQAHAREDIDEDLIYALQESVAQANARLTEERTAREIQEEKIVEAIKRVAADFRRDLAHERKDREAEEENLSALLEHACAKLNEAAEL